MFPKLEFHISGLDPEKEYSLFIEFHAVDDNRSVSFPSPVLLSDINSPLVHGFLLGERIVTGR